MSKSWNSKKRVGIARDICGWSEKKKSMDAVVLSTQGRSKIEAFFMGETACKVMELSLICPVWMIKRRMCAQKPVLIALGQFRKRPASGGSRCISCCPAPTARSHCFIPNANLMRFFSSDAVAPMTDLETMWKSAAGREIAPYMQKSKGNADKGRPKRITDFKSRGGRKSQCRSRHIGCGPSVWLWDHCYGTPGSLPM